MNDNLDFSGEAATTDQPARTNIELFNPGHEANSDKDVGNSARQFEAARAALNFPGSTSREVLVGELLIGCQEVFDKQDPEYLLDTVSSILGHEVVLAEDDE